MTLRKSEASSTHPANTGPSTTAGSSTTSSPSTTAGRLLKLAGNLTFQVGVALVAAVILGYFFPSVAVKMESLGVWFIAIIKIFIPFIIFLTIVSGISGMSDLKKVGRIGVKSLLYFEIVTTVSLAIGILLAHFLQPGRIDRAGLTTLDASKYTRPGAAHFDWGAFFQNNLTLQVLILAIIVGIIVSRNDHREKILSRAVEPATKFVFGALKYFMRLAPLGAFGGMAFTIGKFGIRMLIPLGKLMLTMYGTMIVFIFGVLGSILYYYRLSVWKYLKDIRGEILIVLGTSSSESALPSLMEKLVKMGCGKSVVGLVVPTGYSFNLDGTSIYLSMSVIFLAQLYNVHLSAGEMATILGILMITSKGAAGVTGSGFTILAGTLAAVQKIPLEGLAFLLAIDKFMSEARAITNIIGNGVATLVIAKNEGDFTPNPAFNIGASPSSRT
ncbi:MAG: cation:dicarboxylase symporter family transporter [Puia sp.]|nr:cation:dicarboxylase symporter family transporter [Puia sp.]